MRKLSEKKVSDRMVKNLASKMYHADRYTDEDPKNFLHELNPYADCNAFVNPSAGDWPDAGYIKLIGGLIGLTVVCARLMIYTIYYISMAKNVAQYGQLKLVGVTGGQIQTIVRRHALRQYLTGFPIGCLLGAVSGYALMPILASYMGIEGNLAFMERAGSFGGRDGSGEYCEQHSQRHCREEGGVLDIAGCLIGHFLSVAVIHKASVDIPYIRGHVTPYMSQLIPEISDL